MLKRLAIGVLALGLCLLVGGAPADSEPAAKEKRTLYVVKYGGAKDLAAALAKHFKGDADVQLLPEAPSNCLLIRAAPPVFDEVLKVLEQLDRRPREVSVEVLVATVVPKKGEGDKDLDERELTGPAKDVEAKVEDLMKRGRLAGLRRVRLTALENRPASVFAGDLLPFVMGVTTTATGRTARTITYHNTGISVRLTPYVTPEKAIQLDLMVEDGRAAIPENGVALGQDENQQTIRAPEFITSKVETKLDVPSGHTVAAKGVKTTAKSAQAQTVVLVTAQLVEPAGETKEAK